MILADSYSTSSGVPGIVWSLAIAGLFAWRGYRAAVEVERINGRSPYGWEPVTWSIICFCTALFGRLLLAAGASRARNRTSSSYAAVPEWIPPPAPAWTSPAPPPPSVPIWTPTPARDALVESAVSQAAVLGARGLESPVETLQMPVDAEIATPAPLPSTPTAPATPAAMPSAITILPSW
jgi:hypothetical protein